MEMEEFGLQSRANTDVFLWNVCDNWIYTECYINGDG